ncbi:Alpha/beta hydrolase [Candidatus Magnetomoraceae bacterium gMMP-15]
MIIKQFHTETINFMSDNLNLKGTLHLPFKKNPPVVIGSHGLFSSSASPKQIELAEKCNQAGIAFFRFDHRGCGQSDGEFKKVTTVKGRCNDMKAAIKTIQDRVGLGKRSGLFGSSMGGTIALLTAFKISINAIVTLAAPISLNSLWHILVKNKQDQLLNPEFYQESLDFNIEQHLSQLNHILMVHGDSDEVVPISNSLIINKTAGEPKRLFIIQKGDHQLSSIMHQKQFIDETLAWFKKFL